VLIGRNPGDVARGKTVHELLLPPVPAGLPSGLLERRPDLLQSEHALFPAELNLAGTRSAVRLSG
jgi:outer membrane protein, multidrug efflux system